MGYALMWIESLAVALLLVATVTACAARWPRRFGQGVVPVLAAFGVFALAAGATFVVGFLKFGARLDTGWFFYTHSWTLLFTVGAVVVLYRGLRRVGPEAAPAARRWPRGRLALALGAMVLLHGITFANMDLAMKVQLAAVRAEAGALALGLAPPPGPHRDNAAWLYQEAFDALTPPGQLPPAWKDKWATWLALDRSQFDPKDKDLREFLGSQGRGLALLRQAAARPDCWFEHNYTQPFDTLLPELEQLRHGATLLALDALAQATGGDRRAALEDVAAVFGIAGHVRQPLLISVAVAVAIAKSGTKALEDVLALTAPRAEDLAALALAEGVSYRRYCQWACRMEEAWGLSAFGVLAAEGAAGQFRELEEVLGPAPMVVFQSPLWRVFFLRDELSAYRRTMAAMQQLAARPYPEAHAGWQELDRALRARRGGILTALLIPAADRVAGAAAEGDAAHQLARLALAVTAYRARTGKHPDQLDDLTPGYITRVPLDPFAGQPLRLKRQGQGVVLYSVGRDLKDDGGTAWDAEKQAGDIVFRLR
jgi:hypothetical protein